MNLKEPGKITSPLTQWSSRERRSACNPQYQVCVIQGLWKCNLLFLLSFSAAIFHSGSSTAVEPSPHSRDLLQLRRYWSEPVSLSVGSWNWRQVNHTSVRYCNVYEYFFSLSVLFSARGPVLRARSREGCQSGWGLKEKFRPQGPNYIFSLNRVHFQLELQKVSLRASPFT